MRYRATATGSGSGSATADLRSLPRLSRSDGPTFGQAVRVKAPFVILLLAGCFGSSNNDVVGPFTGASHRFVVDGFSLPVDNISARRFGGDLSGDGIADNQAGQVIGTMAGEKDITTHTADMIAAGALASHVEILADNPRVRRPCRRALLRRRR